MKTALISAAAASLLIFTAPSAFALFKVVGPDGRVTYTDRVPSPSEGRAQTVNKDNGSASDVALPYALRQVATRFPVTLYTSGDCGDACSLARNFLARRGVPYSERIATSIEERESWQNLIGGTQTPALKVGSQMLHGYVPASWDDTLDVAGYPRQSLLPSSYQPPAATPLVPPRPAAAKPQPPTRPDVAADPGANPSGIRF